MKSLVLIFLSCLVSATAFGLGSRRPAEPPQYERPALKKSGTVFTDDFSSCSNYADCQERLQYFASQSCESGRARRISSWQHLPVLEMRLPGDCREIDGRNYCTGGSVDYFYPVRAKFRCK